MAAEVFVEYRRQPTRPLSLRSLRSALLWGPTTLWVDVPGLVDTTGTNLGPDGAGISFSPAADNKRCDDCNVSGLIS